MPGLIQHRYLTQCLSFATEIQESFLALMRSADWTTEDGRAAGEALCVKTEGEKIRKEGESKVGARVRLLFEKNLGLREVGGRCHFFEAMMVRVVENKSRPARDINSKMRNVSVKEATVIGAGLALAMATNLAAEAGVDEWILRYRCLGELDRAEPWFRPMLDTVGKRLIGRVSWGLKLRVTIGAGISMLDLFADAIGYMGKDETRLYGWNLVWMIVATMALQCTFVIIKNKRILTRATAFDILVILTGLKPGVDSYNICSGKQIEEHHRFDPKTEQVAIKLCETALEAEEQLRRRRPEARFVRREKGSAGCVVA